jgi:hypothetical protein
MRAQPVTEFLRFSQLDLREVRARPAARGAYGPLPDKGTRRATTENDDAHAQLVMIATARLCGLPLRRLSARGRRMAAVPGYERR